MGVYIKGMEMPKNCGECLLAKLSPTGESLICNYMLSRVSWEERPFDCPLVPVPPHGRLLDESKIFEMLEVQREDEYNKTHRPKATWSRVMVCFEALLGIVDTAIQAEEGEA